MEIEALVKEAKRGDKDALVQLILAQKQDYYKLAFAYLENKDDALDAMEDMIVILYENIPKLKKDEAFYSWSKTILANCCKKLLRKRKSIVSLETVEEMASEDYFKQMDNQLLLEKYLLQLNEKQQEVIRLHYLLDLDYQTIASILRIPVGTVKSRISIGLKRLAENLGGEGLA